MHIFITGNLKYIGNPLDGATYSKILGAKGVFLMNNLKLEKGKVQSFFALMRNGNPITFQIWRPTGGGTHLLVGEVRVIPDKDKLNTGQKVRSLQLHCVQNT